MEVKPSPRVTDDMQRAGIPAGPHLRPAMSPKANAAKAATESPLRLEDTLHDLAVIRTADIDLAAILSSTLPGSSSVAPSTEDASVARSHEFTQAARAAIRIKNRGNVEAQGERVNVVRGQLEEVVEGLVDGSTREKVVQNM